MKYITDVKIIEHFIEHIFPKIVKKYIKKLNKQDVAILIKGNKVYQKLIKIIRHEN